MLSEDVNIAAAASGFWVARHRQPRVFLFELIVWLTLYATRRKHDNVRVCVWVCMCDGCGGGDSWLTQCEMCVTQSATSQQRFGFRSTAAVFSFSCVRSTAVHFTFSASFLVVNNTAFNTRRLYLLSKVLDLRSEVLMHHTQWHSYSTSWEEVILVNIIFRYLINNTVFHFYSHKEILLMFDVIFEAINENVHVVKRCIIPRLHSFWHHTTKWHSDSTS